MQTIRSKRKSPFATSGKAPPWNQQGETHLRPRYRGMCTEYNQKHLELRAALSAEVAPQGPAGAWQMLRPSEDYSCLTWVCSVSSS